MLNKSKKYYLFESFVKGKKARKQLRPIQQQYQLFRA